MSDLNVIRVSPAEAAHWICEIHYAKRLPNVMFAFGLFLKNEPVGYVTYGSPSSAPLRRGVAGCKYQNSVIELNRLVFRSPIKNGPSMLVGRSLRMLPYPSIVVSYADTSVGHIGYVYQACNFLYTGLSEKRSDWKIRGAEGMHGQSVADISLPAKGGGKGARAEFMRAKFGDDFYLAQRARKHRYLYICARKREKKEIVSALKYKILPYPKGESSRVGEERSIEFQPMLFCA